MLASWFRILWGDGLPVQALIMDTRLPNIEHGGAGGRTPKRLALFLCFPNFASHVRTPESDVESADVIMTSAIKISFSGWLGLLETRAY